MYRTHRENKKINNKIVLKRTVVTTSDGSSTLKIEEWGETYHSAHGAVQEALHVYIKNGFKKLDKDSYRVLEMGFGTGLNALLTFIEAEQNKKKVVYHGVEGFPIKQNEVAVLNYTESESMGAYGEVFQELHRARWGEEVDITDFFKIKKIETQFESLELTDYYNLVYFDVFGYPYQPELWSEAIFAKMYDALSENGLLVTYACRGVIKKAMKQAGFEIEVVAGPPGKREMLLAWKL